MPSNTISIAIQSSSAGFGRGLSDAQKKLKGFDSSTRKASLGLGTLVKGFLGFQALNMGKRFLGDVISEGREAQKVMAQTNAVIKSTGGVANVSAKQVGSLANSISRKTGIDDEQIQKGSNLLLTFKNIHNEVGKGNKIFDLATQSAVDLSAAGFGSVESASKSLGKALNDPVKGMTALSKQGVTFTAQQKEQIKTLVASGDVLGAQKIILKEVASQVGGSAAAQATAGEKLRVTMDNIKESIGTKLLPILDKVATYFVTKIPQWMGTASRAFDKVKSVLAPLEPAFDKVFGFLKKNPAVVKTFAIVLGVLALGFGAATLAAAAFTAVLAVNPIVLVIVAIAALAAGLVYAYKKSETFRNIVDTAFTAIKTAVTTLIPVFKSLLPTIQAVFAGVMQIISGAFTVIRGIFQVLGGLLKGDWSMVWDGIKNILSGAWSVIKGIISIQWAIIKGIFSAAGAALKAIFSGLWNGLKSIVSSAWNGIKSLVSGGINKAKSLISSGWNAAKSLTSKAWAAIKSAVSAGISKAVSTVKGLPGKIKSALGNLGGLLKGAGKAIVQGLINGVTGMIGSLKKRFSSITKMIPNWKGPLSTDKKLLVGAGAAIMDGLINGVDSKERALQKTLTGVTQTIAGTKMPDLAVDMSAKGPALTPAGFAQAFGGSGSSSGNTYNVTIVAPVGSNDVEIGKTFLKYIDAAEGSGARRRA